MFHKYTSILGNWDDVVDFRVAVDFVDFVDVYGNVDIRVGVCIEVEVEVDEVAVVGLLMLCGVLSTVVEVDFHVEVDEVAMMLILMLCRVLSTQTYLYLHNHAANSIPPKNFNSRIDLFPKPK